MISWGEEKLSKGDWRITVNPSISSLRLLKAGALVQVRDNELEKKKYLESEGSKLKYIVSQLDERIAQMSELAESGLLKGLRPADVYSEIYPLEALRYNSGTESEMARSSESGVYEDQQVENTLKEDILKEPDSAISRQDSESLINKNQTDRSGVSESDGSQVFTPAQNLGGLKITIG